MSSKLSLQMCHILIMSCERVHVAELSVIEPAAGIKNMTTCKSVPVFFGHFEVPEDVEGNFKANTVASASQNMISETYEREIFVFVFEIQFRYL